MAKSVKKKNEVDENQLVLIHRNKHNVFWYSTLFNPVYLQNDVPVFHTDVWLDDEVSFEEFLTKFQNFVETLEGENPNSWSERTTINRFIKPVLEMLGYVSASSDQVEPWLEDEPFSSQEVDGSKVYKPDFVIVHDHKELKHIQNETKAEKKLLEARESVILPIEAKYWGRIDEYRQNQKEDLKRADKKNNGESSRTMDFDEQCLKYMDILNKQYGILTDGKTWRLYNLGFSSPNYRPFFQFNLGHMIKHVQNSDFLKSNADYQLFRDEVKYFYFLFRKKALFSESGEELFVDELLNYSKKYVARVEEDLTDRFVNAMTIACNGFQKAAQSSSEGINVDVIRSVSESHIFNILFLKYCEARNILPIKQDPEGYRKISISEVLDRIERFDPKKEADNLNYPLLKRMFSDINYDPSGSQLYDRLLKLTKIVQDGTNEEFKGFTIKGFKKSIYSKEEWKFAQRFKISNQEMIRILFELGYSESDIQGRKYQQIPYDSFSPRQLGSIYESFLEFRLERAREDLAFIKHEWVPANLKSDKIKAMDVFKVKKGDLYFTPSNERKATGSFYTPDTVVQYAVQVAIDQVLKGKSSDEILGIKICDPAMGSGHFLSAALGYLSKKYLEALDRETNDDMSLSLTAAKKVILHNCIFGVDINSRAVKLAKMSLWLESADAAEELEDLEGQIKCADSLSLTQKFDWKKVFSSSFDVVIGNPPWGANIDSLRAEIEEKYGEVSKNHKEIYKLFIQVANEILSSNGVLSFVLPAGILYQPRSKDVREYILKNSSLQRVVNLGDGVFGDVVCPSCIVFAGGESYKRDSFEVFDVSRIKDLSSKIKDLYLTEPQTVSHKSALAESGCEFTVNNSNKFNSDNFYKLEEVIELKDSGINYQRVGVGLGEKGKSDLADRLLYEGKRENAKDIMYWKGEDINAFFIEGKTDRYVRHNWKAIPKKNEVVRIAVDIFRQTPKLVWRQTASQPIAAVDEIGIAFGRSIQAGLLLEGFNDDWYYFLGILFNSTFFRNCYKEKVLEEGRVFPQIKLAKLRELPVPKIDQVTLKEAKNVYRSLCKKNDQKLCDEFINGVLGRVRGSKKKAA